MTARIALTAHLTALACLAATAQPALTRPAPEAPPLLPEPIVTALAQELSGEAAMRELEFLARQHRMRASRGFRAAAEHVLGRLREHGLEETRIEQFPADGRTFYGTQKARPAWDAEFAELWELRPAREGWEPAVRLASWEAMPITLAQDSESAEVTADLVDVGEGKSEGDYAGKEVKGRLVLVSSQPEAVEGLAIDRHGAAGIVSYAQNQKSAWWGEDETLVRWGHLDSFAARPAFAFMVSLKQARDFRERLARGETVRLRAVVRAGKHPGSYDVVTAAIPGADAALRAEEIVFTCHLDHPRPGANDNASGCSAILEIARALSKLLREGRIPRPARTLRFVWPPEVEGTLALLNSRPEWAARVKAVVHLDMVGGGPETKAIFHVTRGPASLPSFVYDVGAAFGEFVNRQSAAFAGGSRAAWPLTAPEGGKEALLAEMAEYTGGSDHSVYAEGSFRIPPIYVNDWPDRYIHTSRDVPANIDPTKLKRAAFIGAASGYFLARLGPDDLPGLWRAMQAGSLRRAAILVERRAALSAPEAANLTRFHSWYERAVVDSLARFFRMPADRRVEAAVWLANLETLVGRPAPAEKPRGDGRLVFRRNPAVKGPMTAFGYDYFEDHYGAEKAKQVRLLKHEGLRGSGGDYAYEALNFVDGRRTAQEIRDAVSAACGPVPLDVVVEYLRALESIGVVERAL